MNLRLCQYFRKCIATCIKTSSGCFRKSSRTNANSCRKFQWKNNNVLRKWDLEKNVSLQVLIALQCSKPLLQRMYHIVNAFRTFSIFKRNSAWRPQYSFIFFLMILMYFCYCSISHDMVLKKKWFFSAIFITLSQVHHSSFLLLIT